MKCIAKSHELGVKPAAEADYMWLTQANFWMPLCVEHCAGWRRSATPATMPKRVRSVTQDDEMIGAYFVLCDLCLVWHERDRVALLAAAKNHPGVTV